MSITILSSFFFRHKCQSADFLCLETVQRIVVNPGRFDQFESIRYAIRNSEGSETNRTLRGRLAGQSNRLGRLARVYALSFFRLQLPARRDATDSPISSVGATDRRRPCVIYRDSVGQKPSSTMLACWKGRLIARSAFPPAAFGCIELVTIATHSCGRTLISCAANNNHTRCKWYLP